MNNLNKIGILGGGQLARMMLLEGHRLGLDCSVLSAHKDDPAAQVTQNWVEGNIDDLATVFQFAKSVDIITFESEFIKPNILDAFEETGILTAPASKHMKIVQDRLSQKNILEKYSIPTSPFYQIDNSEDLEKIKSDVELPLVIKARLGGYDGKGTFILKDWDGASWDQCRTFLNRCSDGAIAEHFIPFKRELAISVARNARGQVCFFPLVESYQEECRCLWVKGPMDHAKLADLKLRFEEFLNKEEYIGFISFELFDSEKGLMVNEIAPRVHNSAHYSQNGLSVDQFSCHLKAVLNHELVGPKTLGEGFAMYNLIGSNDSGPKLKTKEDIFLHWYGKKENRPGRKMGHLNSVAADPDQALKKLIEARKEIQL